MASQSTTHTRALYRAILRELPSVPQKAASSSSTPLRQSIRQHFLIANKDSNTLARRQEADQFVQYLRAQRMYGTLIDRYNPGMTMDEEERVRLTARRVGMDMPVEWYGTGKKGGE